MRENLLTGHFFFFFFLFRAMKRTAIMNGFSNFIVKFNFVPPLQEWIIDPLLRNQPCHNNDFYLIIKWHKVGSTTLGECIAC